MSVGTSVDGKRLPLQLSLLSGHHAVSPPHGWRRLFMWRSGELLLGAARWSWKPGVTWSRLGSAPEIQFANANIAEASYHGDVVGEIPRIARFGLTTGEALVFSVNGTKIAEEFRKALEDIGLTIYERVTWPRYWIAAPRGTEVTSADGSRQ